MSLADPDRDARATVDRATVDRATVDRANSDRATIDDVARRAGVSVATVSRAMRGLPNVAAGTRARIEQVADELDYSPDPAASRLAAGRTNTITIGILQLNGWYFSNVVAGAEAVCAEAGLEFQVIGISSPADLDRLLDPTARLERRTDALALVDIGLTRDRADELLRRGIPVGTIGFRVEGHLAVQLDDHGVGAIAADHLLEIGVRRPAMIAGVPDHPMRRRVPDLRADGFRSSLAAAGRPLVAVAADSFGVTGGQRAMASILDELGDDLPDGVFAMSDELAFGAIMELRARGITVGFGDGAVALVGVDDHEFAPVVELTTIRQDVASLGRTLALQLIDAVARLREPDARPAAVGATTPPPTTACDRVVTPPVALVRRGSTQPRRRSA